MTAAGVTETLDELTGADRAGPEERLRRRPELRALARLSDRDRRSSRCATALIYGPGDRRAAGAQPGQRPADLSRSLRKLRELLGPARTAARSDRPRWRERPDSAISTRPPRSGAGDPPAIAGGVHSPDRARPDGGRGPTEAGRRHRARLGESVTHLSRRSSRGQLFGSSVIGEEEATEGSATARGGRRRRERRDGAIRPRAGTRSATSSSCQARRSPPCGRPPARRGACRCASSTSASWIWGRPAPGSIRAAVCASVRASGRLPPQRPPGCAARRWSVASGTPMATRSPATDHAPRMAIRRHPDAASCRVSVAVPRGARAPARRGEEEEGGRQRRHLPDPVDARRNAEGDQRGGGRRRAGPRLVRAMRTTTRDARAITSTMKPTSSASPTSRLGERLEVQRVRVLDIAVERGPRSHRN